MKNDTSLNSSNISMTKSKPMVLRSFTPRLIPRSGKTPTFLTQRPTTRSPPITGRLSQRSTGSPRLVGNREGRTLRLRLPRSRHLLRCPQLMRYWGWINKQKPYCNFGILGGVPGFGLGFFSCVSYGISRFHHFLFTSSTGFVDLVRIVDHN